MVPRTLSLVGTHVYLVSNETTRVDETIEYIYSVEAAAGVCLGPDERSSTSPGVDDTRREEL